MMNRISYLLLFACVLALSGCSGDQGGGSRQPVYSVSGTVKLFGTGLSDATVAFAPQNGQPTAFGTTDDQGNFKLTTYDFQDGAAEGTYKVIVSKTAQSAGAPSSSAAGSDHEASEEAASSHDATGGAKTSTGLVPPQYSSSQETPLTAEVKKGEENVFNFDLK